MILVEKHQIKKNSTKWKDCDRLSYIMKNLYNSSLYYIRQHYFSNNYSFKDSSNNYVFNSAQLYHAMKNSKEFRTDQHHEYNGYLANTKILKMTYRQIERTFKGYYKALKSYYNNPNKFTGMPKLPNYKPKKGRSEVTVNKEAISFKKESYAHVSRTNIYVKLINADRYSLKEIKIVPKGDCYEILVSYESKEKSPSTNNPTKIVGLDIGLDNLAALSSNDMSFKPFLVNGRPLKSINQYYNKKKGKFQSLLPKNCHWSNHLSILTRKRNNKLNTELHNASNYILNQLINSGTEMLVVGNNKGIKDSINIGKKNNQNFVGIPFYKLRKMLEYKCKLAGIYYVETEESYTSKCSFLDMEDMKKHSSYQGKRVERGLFKSYNGDSINSDINGSLNIIRKVAGNHCFNYQSKWDLVEGYAVSPLKVTVCN